MKPISLLMVVKEMDSFMVSNASIISLSILLEEKKS